MNPVTSLYRKRAYTCTITNINVYRKCRDVILIKKTESKMI